MKGVKDEIGKHYLRFQLGFYVGFAGDYPITYDDGTEEFRRGYLHGIRMRRDNNAPTGY